MLFSKQPAPEVAPRTDLARTELLQLRAALDDTSADGSAWDRQLSAAILTSAIMVADSETARLSRALAGADLLAAAQAAATSIFERTAHAWSPPTG